MPWWGWIVIGIFLMAAEMFAVDLAFYLIFVGFAAVVVGLVGLAGVTLPIWGQWVLFALLAIVSMYLFREKLYNKLRGGLPGFTNADVGQQIPIEDDVGPGEIVRVKYRGSRWSARNVGDSPIAAGGTATVVQIVGMELSVRAVESQ